jgi:transposase
MEAAMLESLCPSKEDIFLSLPDLRLALEGLVQPHHRFLLRRILAHIDFLEASIVHVQREIEERLTPFEEAVTLVQSVIGIQATAAAAIVAEIGTEMSRFPSDKHLPRWRGHQPGQQTEWWQAPERGDYLRQSLSPSGAGRSGLGDLSH